MSIQYLKRDDQVDLNFTCPAGGQWYACASGSHFVGCCTSDPCSNGCAQGNIRTVGFPADQYGKFPDASCGAASNFFSCASGDRTFWGCCKSNPCANSQTCAEGDLVPAFMERPEQFNVYAPDSEKAPEKHKKGASTGTIVGGVVGGVLGLAIIIALLVFFLCKQKKRNKAKGSEEAATLSPEMRENNDIDAPPMYSSPNPNTYGAPGDHKRTGSTEKTYFRHSTTNTQNFISELPGDTLSPTGPGSSRFSELPAESGNANTNRYSELPAATQQHTAELETPVSSPQLR